ncbi:MAG: hypothetical protein PHX01_06850 [Clostridia bacterium]|nr:hypothetical protein [Clostridia bacterium]
MKKYGFVLLTLLLFVVPVSLGAVELVSLEINEEIIPGKESIPLTVTGTLSNGIKQQIREGLVWKTSDTGIANVTPSGTLYFSGKEGPVTISVYKGKASGKKTVYARPWPKSLRIESTLVYSENPYRLLVKGKFSDGTERYYGPEDKIIWSSSNPWVAWVNNDGVVTFTGEEGYVSIKAISGEYSYSVNTTVAKDREITAWRKGIKIKEEEITYSSQPQQLTLLVLYTDDTEEEIEALSADWSSSNLEVVRVNPAGEVTFTGKPGLATIKVSYGGFHYETLIKVGRFLQEITLNQSLNYTTAWNNVPLPLSVTAVYNDGSQLIQSTNLTWETDNKEVASITEEGVLTFTGEPGMVKITVSGQGEESTTVKDEVIVNVSDIETAEPRRLYIDYNPLAEQGFYTPQVYCIFSSGEKREVTEQVEWTSLTPQVASVYQGTIYLSPNPGKISILASYQGLTDTLSGYSQGIFGFGGQRICQLGLKEHYVPFSFTPVKLTALALKSDGSMHEVNSQLRWHSSQPYVVQVNQKGELTFTGRIGRAMITAQGFGFRDMLLVEVFPEDLQPRVEKLVLEGELARGTNQLKAVAYFNNGTSKEVTNEAVWNSSNKNKAVVTEQGCVMFLGEFAPVTISVHYGGKGAEITRS